jgi:hypothetical protein
MLVYVDQMRNATKVAICQTRPRRANIRHTFVDVRRVGFLADLALLLAIGRRGSLLSGFFWGFGCLCSG